MDTVKKAKLYVDADMTEGELFRLASGTAAVYSAPRPEKKSPNEDAAAIIPLDDNTAVLAVADGAGGLRAGDEASRIALKALRDAVIKSQKAQIELREAILDGIEKANRAVQQLGVGAATTLAVIEIQKNTIRPYHVGDSLILAVGQKGKVKHQTISHSPVGYAVEAGILDESEAIHHEQRHLVSNFIGSQDMRIEIGSAITLSPRDTVIIASDGLTDNLLLEEIVEIARKGTLDEVVDRLIRDCADRMGKVSLGHPSKPDDVTILTFRLYSE